MRDAQSDAALVGYGQGLLETNQVIHIARTGCETTYAANAIQIETSPEKVTIVVATLTNGRRMFFAPGELAYVVGR